ncbi:MAG TPA: dihydrolipoamide acetyltransferase family protein, partial [Anaerovoracaceae bacterium]|nr:dihydrolipoamide acetyltransferase family protein [Anaerovoracaceae bacterium]
TMTEGTISKWLKKEGEYVSLDESVAEIETEKIVNTVEAPVAGKIEKLLFAEGDVAQIGTVIAVIESEAGDTAEAAGRVETGAEDKAGDPVKVAAERRPYAGLRKRIGERMSESWRVSPQGTMTTRADMTELIKLKNEYEAKGDKLSLTDFVVKITALALEKNLSLNAAIEGDDLVIYKSINIGVAVGTDDGLFVPVIRHAEEKNVGQISAELKELTRKAKENRLQSEDITGGTFTVNNLGMFDVDVVTAIVNPPEAAILAIGTTRKEAVVDEENDTVRIRPMTTLSVTADHRLTDGIPVVKFLKDIKEIMKNPAEYPGM